MSVKIGCDHTRLHYMGCGPLPKSRSDCRWNYVCIECRHWLKVKRVVELRCGGRYEGELPQIVYESGPERGLDYGVPKCDAIYAWGSGWVLP